MDQTNNIDNSKNVNTGTVTSGRDTIIGDVTIYNNIHVNAPKYLTNRPFKADIVLGREIALKNISENLWNKDNLLLLVNGEGGIGKTTLASHYWLFNENKYNHLGWLYVGDGFLPALLAMAKNLELVFDVTMDDNARLHKTLQYLSNIKAPSLLVLDNFNDTKDLQKYYKHLKSLTNFHIILTSRINEFANVNSFKVENLDLNTSIELFKNYYDNITEDDIILLESIFVAVGFNTLVIELLAKNIREFNKFRPTYSIKELLIDLQESGLLKLKTKSIQTTYGGDELQNARPEEVIRAMYKLTNIDIEQVKLLSNFSVLPPDNIAYEILDQLLKPSDKNKFDENLQTLYQKGWVDYNKEKQSFKCSPVIQAVLQDKHQKKLLEYNKHLIEGIIDIFFNKNHTELVPFASFAVSILKSLKDRVPHIADLSLKLSKYFQEIGNLPEAISYINRSKIIFHQVGNKKAYSDCEFQIAQIYEIQGKVDEASIHYSESNKILGSNSKFQSIKFELKNVKILISQGKVEEALKILLQLHEFTDNLNKKNNRTEPILDTLAEICQFLGIAYYNIGSYKLALDFFDNMRQYCYELIEINQENDEYKISLGVSFGWLGMINRDHFDLNKATTLFKEYYSLSKEFYNTNPKSENIGNNFARAIDYLGRIYLDNGGLTNASIYLTESNSLCKKLFENNPNSEAVKVGLSMSYDRLGDLCMKKGEIDEAILNYLKYNRLNLEIYNNNPKSVGLKNGLGLSYRQLGIAYERNNNFIASLNYFKEYNKIELEIFRNNRASPEMISNLANSHVSLGIIYNKLSNRIDARLHYLEALKLWSQLCENTKEHRYCAFAAKALQDLNSL